jgi:hypothetical protein
VTAGSFWRSEPCFGGVGGFVEQAGVVGGEIRLGHVHLAADFEHVWHIAGELRRYVGNRLHVLRHHLAGGAVAAGSGEDEHALFVAQRAGEAVDLGLGGERNLGVYWQAQEATEAGKEVRDFVIAERVLEAEHRQCVLHL